MNDKQDLSVSFFFEQKYPASAEGSFCYCMRAVCHITDFIDVRKLGTNGLYNGLRKLDKNSIKIMNLI